LVFQPTTASQNKFVFCVASNDRDGFNKAWYTIQYIKVKQSRYTPWRRLGGEEV
jgi:hypothetical protein